MDGMKHTPAGLRKGSVCVGGCLSHAKFILGNTSRNDWRVELLLMQKVTDINSLQNNSRVQNYSQLPKHKGKEQKRMRERKGLKQWHLSVITAVILGFFKNTHLGGELGR